MYSTVVAKRTCVLNTKLQYLSKRSYSNTGKALLHMLLCETQCHLSSTYVQPIYNRQITKTQSVKYKNET